MGKSTVDGQVIVRRCRRAITTQECASIGFCREVVTRGRPHTFQIRSETARVLQVSTPAQFERFVAALGRPTDKPVLPEPEETDGAHVAAVCAEFSIEVLGPPPAPFDDGSPA